jgi:hypothetical protein
VERGLQCKRDGNAERRVNGNEEEREKVKNEAGEERENDGAQV